MKKIHCYITSLEGGGAERQMSYLCSFLSERGYDVTLVTMLDVDDKYDVANTVKRVCLGYKLSDNVILKLLKKIRIFLYFLTVRTDCVISYLIGSNAHVLRPMMFRPNVKVIVGERNFVTWELSEEEKYIYGKLYDRANYVVSNSYSMERYLADFNPSLKPHLRTITNYTDTSKYKTTPLLLGEKLQIGVFARFEKQKNYERFAEMLNIVKKTNHRPFVVRWYGDKRKDSCYTHFCELIDKYSIHDLIELHDFVKDVPKAMESIDIICLPSLYEGFSNSLSEAICSGKPVIAGEVSDNGVIVRDGFNGKLFNPSDVQDMVAQFLLIVNSDNDNLRKMSINSRKRAEELFSKDKFIESYTYLIEN